MNRKLIFPLLYLSFFVFVNIDAQWVKEKSPTGKNLKSISCISDNSGWIVGDDGTILYKDSNNWIEYSKPTNENLNSIYMLDKNNGWAVGAKGTIIHFDGNKWNSFKSPTKSNLLSVYFKDSDNGVAVGEFGTIIIYKDGFWKTSNKGTMGKLYTAFIQNDNVWIAGGLECVNFPIMKMIYNEELSLSSKAETFATVNGVFFLNENDGWAVGSPSTLLHFNGVEWKKPEFNENFASLNSVYFKDENNGISVGYGGTILIYSDGNWLKENSFITQKLNSAAIFDNTYYAVGDNGTIINKMITAKETSSNIDQQISKSFNLFPNPCNDILNINIPAQNEDNTCYVSVINSSGRILLQKELHVKDGNFNYSLSTDHLDIGAYLLIANLNKKTMTNKFIVSR